MATLAAFFLRLQLRGQFAEFLRDTENLFL